MQSSSKLMKSTLRHPSSLLLFSCFCCDVFQCSIWISNLDVKFSFLAQQIRFTQKKKSNHYNLSSNHVFFLQLLQFEYN